MQQGQATVVQLSNDTVIEDMRHWVTLTFDSAFCWAKIRSKSRLKSKSSHFAEQIAKFGLSDSINESVRPKLLSKYVLRPKLSYLFHANSTDLSQLVQLKP